MATKRYTVELTETEILNLLFAAGSMLDCDDRKDTGLTPSEWAAARRAAKKLRVALYAEKKTVDANRS
jgi:hypothetical protein